MLNTRKNRAYCGWETASAKHPDKSFEYFINAIPPHGQNRGSPCEVLMKQSLDPNAVADFLLDNPQFFNEYAELLAEVQLSSPLLGKTVSLQERQIELLREKNKGLDQRIAELVRIARDNDVLMHRMQVWSRALLQANSEIERVNTLVDELKGIFSVPFVTVRLWHLAEPYKEEWFAKDVSDAIMIFSQGLQVPYCGKNNDFEASRWFGEAAQIESVVLAPLRTGVRTFGLLVLGSPVETRFRADMATDYLAEIAKTAGSALACLMDDD